MVKEIRHVDLYTCPYCKRIYRNRLGKINLDKHVKAEHHKEYKDFLQTPEESYHTVGYVKKERVLPGEVDMNTIDNKVKEEETEVEIEDDADIGEVITTKAPRVREVDRDPANQPPPPNEQSPPPQHPPVTQQPMYVQPVYPQQQPYYQQPQQPMYFTAVQPAPQTQNPQTQEQSPEQFPFPTFRDDLEPDVWLKTFLQQYKLKPAFIQIQVDQVKLTNELPYASTLMDDMKAMDSGQNNLRTISYIINMYEHQLRKYLAKREAEASMSHRRYGVSVRNPSGGYRQGIPADPYGQPQESRYGYEARYDPLPPMNRGTSFYETRLEKLETELRRRDEEARQRQLDELRELKQELRNQAAGQEDPAIAQLRMELKQNQNDYRMLMEKYQQQRDDNLRKELEDMKRSSRGPSWEQIQSYTAQAIQAEHDRITARDLDDRISAIMKNRTGMTPEDVEMKKAEIEYELGKNKIEAETRKGEMYMNTFKSVAELFGEGIGKGLSGAKMPSAQPQPMPTEGYPAYEPPSQQRQQPPLTQPQQIPGMPPDTEIHPCPYCGTPLALPPDAEFGMCPTCDGQIQRDETGLPQKFQIEEKDEDDFVPPPPLPSEQPPLKEPAYRFPPPYQYNPEPEEPIYQAPPPPQQPVVHHQPTRTVQPPQPRIQMQRPMEPEHFTIEQQPLQRPIEPEGKKKEPELPPKPVVQSEREHQREHQLESEPILKPVVQPGPEPEPEFVCDTCGKTFDNRLSLRGHLSSHVPRRKTKKKKKK